MCYRIARSGSAAAGSNHTSFARCSGCLALPSLENNYDETKIESLARTRRPCKLGCTIPDRYFVGVYQVCLRKCLGSEDKWTGG